MNTVADILTVVESIAPRYMKMDWDNVGLLCGSRKTPVTKVLVALDPFEGVCQEAARLGAELIVTHHPLIFHPLKAVTDETEVGRCIQLLCAKGISAINAHTNLDCAPEGGNFRLAQKLGLSGIEVIDPNGTDEQGNQWGLLRKGTVEEQPLERFLTTVKQQLGQRGMEGIQRRREKGAGRCLTLYLHLTGSLLSYATIIARGRGDVKTVRRCSHTVNREEIEKTIPLIEIADPFVFVFAI